MIPKQWLDCVCGELSQIINTPLVAGGSGRLLSLRLSGGGNASLRSVGSAHSASGDSGVKINSLLELVKLKSVLVLELLLHVLVSLEHSLQLNCSLLLLLILPSFNSLLKGLHFIEMLSRQLLFGCRDLSISSVVVLTLFLSLEFLGSDLNLVGLSVFFLASEIDLDFLEVEEFG